MMSQVDADSALQVPSEARSASRKESDLPVASPTRSLDVFETWWLPLYPRLLSRARWFSGSYEDAHDLVQDVAVLALRRLQDQGFASEADFARWAYTRLRWLFLDRLRASKHTTALNEPIVDIEQRAAQETTTAARETIVGGLKQLPERQRAVLSKVLVGHSTKEIAQELGMAEATVRSALRHARVRLAKHLAQSQVNR